MPSAAVPPSTPIEGVVFDFHYTLVDPGEPRTWLELAWRHLKRQGEPADSLEPGTLHEILGVLDHVWVLARDVDPEARRDLDPATHERVFRTVLSRVPGVDEELATSLYAALPDLWVPYDDAHPVLQALHDRGLPAAILSNVGFDVRPVLERTGIDELIAGLVLSFEVGVVKPDAAIFERALALIGVPADRALMVGDNSPDDGAAAALGIRTLILPPTRGSTHGLDAVLRLVG